MVGPILISSLAAALYNVVSKQGLNIHDNGAATYSMHLLAKFDIMIAAYLQIKCKSPTCPDWGQAGRLNSIPTPI
jgi:hypothetical protein